MKLILVLYCFYVINTIVCDKSIAIKSKGIAKPLQTIVMQWFLFCNHPKGVENHYNFLGNPNGSPLWFFIKNDQVDAVKLNESILMLLNGPKFNFDVGKNPLLPMRFNGMQN